MSTWVRTYSLQQKYVHLLWIIKSTCWMKTTVSTKTAVSRIDDIVALGLVYQCSDLVKASQVQRLFMFLVR